MAVLKNKTQGLYVNVSKDILLDQKLSLRDRGMLVTILSLSDNWDFNLKGFSKILPDGVDCIRSSVNELMKRGYLTGGQERNGRGRFGKNVIEVHQVPVPPQLENPITVNPFAEKSKTVPSITGTPHTEHPTQVINNKVNNKKVNNHQSIFQRKDGETEVIPTISKSLVPMQKLIERFEYSKLCQILSYHHLLQECRECQLSQYEIKARVIEELKYLISYETLVFDGDGAMVDALLDYMSEIIATDKTITFNNGETYDARSMGNQFYRLDSGAIRYVLEKFDEVSQDTRIVNKKNYLIRMLLTAKSDLETSIKSDVNYDMAHWHERGNE